MRVLMLSLLLAMCGMASAQVYKYTDEKGVVHYTDKPPAKDSKPVELPPLQTYSPSEAAVTPGPVSEPAMPKPKFQVSITSPSPDETFRDPLPEVQVAASVMPSLPEGFGLIYFVDNVAVTDPVPQTSWTVGGLVRGEHKLAVAMVDGNNKVVARSAPVTVYMHPPKVAPAAPRPKPRT